MDNVKALRVANDQTGLFKLGLDGDFNRQDAGGDSPRVTPLQTIWNRRLLVCIIVGVCGIAFGLYAKSRTKIYTRSCQIVIEPANAKVIASCGSAAGSGECFTSVAKKTDEQVLDELMQFYLYSIRPCDANNRARGTATS